jgi:hypothetical protein
MTAPETKPEATQAPAAQKTEASKEKPVVEVEKQTNCLGCNKPIRKIKRYYRDGKFYCNKKCWRNYITKAKEEKK